MLKPDAKLTINGTDKKHAQSDTLEFESAPLSESQVFREPHPAHSHRPATGNATINVWSTSGLGGNIVVRDNKITEIRDAAIAIKGCDGISIIDK